MKQKRTYLKIKDCSLKIGDFLDKKGFYLVIFLCIVVIGATIGIVSIRDYQKLKINYETENSTTGQMASDYNAYAHKIEKSEAQTVIGKVSEQPELSGNAIKVDSNKNIAAEEKQNPKVKQFPKSIEKNNENSIKNKNENKQNKADAIIKESNEPLSLDWPVFGKITSNFAKDSLIFSNTLQQWTTHEGIDINCKEGTPVRTAAEGVVKSIKNDPVYGITVIIEHKDGINTVYSNLSTAKMVKVGQVVKRGKVISGVGRTAGFECEDEAHLHFEVTKDGERINPVEYLTKI